jgi:hypothetical protein
MPLGVGTTSAAQAAGRLPEGRPIRSGLGRADIAEDLTAAIGVDANSE